MQPLIVPATLDCLTPVSDYVLAAASAAGLDKRATYRLRLAVVELVTNAIDHGYTSPNPQNMIVVNSEMDGATLTITLEDTATAYDPRETPPPSDMHLPAEERQIGGLGVYLVLQDVDRFLYERVGNRNRCVLVMNRPGSVRVS